ncbi:hypothetical protein MSG28_009880 [Choristoneura fumiferana]|uniref:Uncharacterized protein n=1 Tax=Choristoneura fumiferana TaxID=7141 RepID=A0ACC0JD02_CHOFU|nr:hypothetical protein MSG28_009880 [Choristoneura fumiferana]
MISLPITGFVADRWGRRLALFLTINCSWISCIKYWINSYTSYIILEFLEALIGGAAFSSIEYVGSKHRAAAGAAMTSFVAMGLTLQSIISWTGIYWRYLILIFNAPLLIVIFCLWIAPESVRWLMSKGRYEESKVILENAAKMNGNILSDKTLKDLSEGLKLEEKNKNESEPWLICLSSAIWELLPFVLFAGMAFLSGLLVLLAPETLGVKLPDTMQEANDLGRHSHSSILKPLRRLLFRQKSYTLR